MLLAALSSCSKSEIGGDYDAVDFEYGKTISHDMIVLGDRLENPYKTVNMQKAYAAVYPTKSGQEIQTTNLYVRFRLKTASDFETLTKLGVSTTDFPLDYAIVKEGDYYHDPEIEEEDITWQYGVVSKDFSFPQGIEYEIIDECFLSENAPATRAFEGVDWEAVERESYCLTDNADRLAPQTRAGEKCSPSGRITIVDPQALGGKPVGVSGVKIVANTFVKFASAYTDRDGYYKMDKEFSSNLHYRLLFKNEKGFAIGLNLVLVPASVSTLGKASPEGVNVTVTEDSDKRLFSRCAVNNSAYEYLSRCESSDLNIQKPASDLRFWIFHNMETSSAIMMRHGAMIDDTVIGEALGEYAKLVKAFLPDITIGVKNHRNFHDIYGVVFHEMAHASHFAKVGVSYWDKYILYVMTTFVKSLGQTYGDGKGQNAGLCEVGEMWGYYIQSKAVYDRYGDSWIWYGSSYWFFPQIFRYLEERGMTPAQIFAAMDGSSVTRASLQSKLETLYPEKASMIRQIFNRYQE